jgi:hypothetical protein
MFTAREDGALEVLTRGPTPNHRQSIYEEAPYYPVDRSPSSASNFESLCRVILPLYHHVTRISDRGGYYTASRWTWAPRRH